MGNCYFRSYFSGGFWYVSISVSLIISAIGEFVRMELKGKAEIGSQKVCVNRCHRFILKLR